MVDRSGRFHGREYCFDPETGTQQLLTRGCCGRRTVFRFRILSVRGPRSSVVNSKRIAGPRPMTDNSDGPSPRVMSAETVEIWTLLAHDS